MWKIEDFWKIFNYIKYNEPSDLKDSLKAISKSELTKSTEFFENTLDQLSFSNSDFLRIRKFLIEWYSSHKALTSLQKDILDIYPLPDAHMDEAFKSKGFNFSSKLSTYGTSINYNKGNLYFDLVNLYKKKGSPRTLLNALRYFGFPNIEILEYMTYRRKSTDKVEFHSISADHTGKWWSTEVDILSYDEATGNDPHYLTSEKSIIYGQNKSHLHLPTKSPYFSLRHFININEYTKLTSFLSRKIQDQYNTWLDHIHDPSIPELPKELFINSCTMETSVLELYLACIYTYYKHYGTEISFEHPDNTEWKIEKPLGDHGEYFDCYDGTDVSSVGIAYNLPCCDGTEDPNNHEYVCCDGTATAYITMVENFQDYLDNIPITRDEIKENQNHYLDLFARITSKNFLVNEETAGDILQVINPELCNRLADLYDVKPLTIILGNLVEDLMRWINSYASVSAPHLNFLFYGTEEFKRILFPLLDFFKPYHARLLSYDMVFINDDRNSESVIVEDNPVDTPAEVIHDWDTCNSKPCCNETCGNATPDSFYSRDTYDCGSYYDIGGACDGREGSFGTEIEDNIHDRLTCQTGTTNIVDYQNPAHEKFGIDPYVETESIDIPIEYHTVQSGNFIDFDEGGCFDNHYANDVCMIQVI